MGMTCEELAAARSIDRQSARRLASRLKWRRQANNQQTVRVYVPPVRDELDRRHRDMPTDDRQMIGTVETVVAALREAHAAELARMTERVTRAEAEIEHQRTRLVRFEFGLETETTRADAEKD